MKNTKAKKAIDAMKALGIKPDIARPVLKHLYNLYDKNWSFIEAENYRALIDAVFEEDKEVETKRKGPVDLDGSEPPFKKLHVVSDEDEASSTVDGSSKRVILEDGDINIPSISVSNGREQTSGMHPVIVKTEFGSLSTIPDSVKLRSGRALSSCGSKCLGEVTGHRPSKKLTVLDSEQCDTDLMPLPRTVSKTSALPDLVDASSTRNICWKSSECVDPEIIKKYASASKFQKTECKLDIVSSTSGDVKLCLVSTIGKATSCTPEYTDCVLKSVEKKFSRTPKARGHAFSVRNLLKDICNSFSESTTDASDELLARKSPEVISQVKLEHLEVLDENKSDSGTSQIDQEGMKRPPQLLADDIAKGEEIVKIALVDEDVNREHPKFFYIPKNIIYQKAIVNISLARISDEDCCSSCSGDCLSASVPCACTRTTNGEFAYTTDGLLKSEFLRDCFSENNHEVFCQDCPMERAKNQKKPGKCKGHAVRKFIKECWSKCGCNMQCGNRVVQRGITRKLEVFWTSDEKGWGLRAAEDLPKGAFVCEYVGEVVTNTELDERNRKSKGEMHTYPVHLDADWNSECILDDDFALCLDATNYGNVARFINHKCNSATLVDIPVEVETVDHHYYHVAFFTAREVKAYEELSWDYGIDFHDRRHPVKAFRCHCGSTDCRDKSHNRKGVKSKPRARIR